MGHLAWARAQKIFWAEVFWPLDFDLTIHTRIEEISHDFLMTIIPPSLCSAISHLFAVLWRTHRFDLSQPTLRTHPCALSIEVTTAISNEGHASINSTQLQLPVDPVMVALTPARWDYLAIDTVLRFQ